MKKGLLLINLGTPKTPNVADVRRYLKTFLLDWRVIDLPWWLRNILVRAFILPFRPYQSSAAYKKIWTPKGSPLLIHSLDLKAKLQTQLPSVTVALGMRYGEPSLNDAMDTLKSCDEITVIPLYPQYASASSGSSIEWVLNYFKDKQSIPSLKIIRDFHDFEPFIKACAQLIAPELKTHDHLLLSYHGLPTRQLEKIGCAPICNAACQPHINLTGACYRSQCFTTSKKIANLLNLEHSAYSTSFQSRLGKTPWIQPFTDDILIQLSQQGIKNLLVACPSFVADCLETLEEIGMRAQEDWLNLGGEKLTLIPSLNASESFVFALIDLFETS